MWIIAWTINRGGNDLVDYWIVAADEEEARRVYDKKLGLDRLHCACIAPINTATEPHWTEVTDSHRTPNEEHSLGCPAPEGYPCSCKRN